MKKGILVGILLLANGFAASAFPQETLHHWQAGADKKPPLTVPDAQKPAPLLLPAGDFSGMRQGDTIVAEQVLDPYRIRLADKRIVQLSGIEIPDFDIAQPGELSLAAQEALKTLLEGKQITLYITRNEKEGRVNRLGHALAQISIGENKTWVQGMLLANGLARAQSPMDQPDMAAAMIKLEDEARAAKKGLWADDAYAVLAPDDAMYAVGKWAIVEGTVHAAAMNNNMVYINFGPDWKNDFTIGVDATMRRLLARTGIDPLNLAGKTVRVRGWVESYNGPYIKLTSPAWLEIPALPPALEQKIP